MTENTQNLLSFTFIANACGIFTGKNGTKILCDPWLVDGVFDGSWCHFSRLKTKPEHVKDVDAIYISHLHPDHFDERFFVFSKSTPLIVLDHEPNFLIKRLSALGFVNLIKIKDKQTIQFKEFELSMFAPFARHNFHEAAVGNLIDSALLVSCDGITALNANDNTLSIDSAAMLGKKYGPINLAMLNYNAAGPYPSCFDNLTEAEKVDESFRLIGRNLNHLKAVITALRPSFILPFAGAYVLGGDLHHKNNYLGTTTWDECSRRLKMQDIEPSKVILLREGDTFKIDSGVTDKVYIPIDILEAKNYIRDELSQIKYPYQLQDFPDKSQLISDIGKSAIAMQERMKRFGITSEFKVILSVYKNYYQIYPLYEHLDKLVEHNILRCQLDERLLRNIIDRKSHWNNAEIGAHISFFRKPNKYEPDLHTGLQFFHL
jgi:UDP-MurNAc hydroxylase